MGSYGEATRALKVAVRGSLSVAALAAVGLSVLGRPAAGAALAAGLLLGSVNGPWIRRGLATSGSFRLASLGRLGLLSLAGVAVGAVLGVDLIWLTLLGLALAQIILAGASLRQGLAA